MDGGGAQGYHDLPLPNPGLRRAYELSERQPPKARDSKFNRHCKVTGLRSDRLISFLDVGCGAGRHCLYLQDKRFYYGLPGIPPPESIRV